MKFLFMGIKFTMVDSYEIYDHESWLKVRGVQFKILSTGPELARAFVEAIAKHPRSVKMTRSYRLIFPNKGIRVLHKLTWGGR